MRGFCTSLGVGRGCGGRQYGVPNLLEIFRGAVVEQREEQVRVLGEALADLPAHDLTLAEQEALLDALLDASSHTDLFPSFEDLAVGV